MTLIFHDLKMIIEVYSDDLTAHSHLRVSHPYHLRLVFKRCHHYQVRLNPHKCIFCVTIGHFLGFIVSKEGIRVNPLKVEAILQLSTHVILDIFSVCKAWQISCGDSVLTFPI